MRVALVSPYSLERAGGVQGQVVGLAAALRARGHQATVLAPGGVRELRWNGHRGGRRTAEGSAAGECAAAGSVMGESTEGVGLDSAVTVGSALAVPANGSVAPIALSPSAAWRTDRLLRTGHYDVVHLHEPFTPVVAYRWLLRPSVATVGTLHRAGGGGLYRAFGPLGRWAVSRLDVTCVVSDAAHRTAEAVLPPDVRVLFNGVVLPPPPASSPAHRPAQRTAGKPAVLFLSRHEPRKGLDVLLEAWCSGQPLPGELWVASQGPETDALRRRYPESERLRWLGVVTEERKRSLLAEADVLCAPSRGGESFGVVLLEAMAARTAVVASNIPGYRDAAAGHAVLTPPGDPAGLRRALIATLADVVAERGAGAPAALDAAARHAGRWSMDELAGRYLDLYAEAIRTHDARRGGGSSVSWASS